MSKVEIKTELNRLNKVIDQKILRGLPYQKEARHHKILLARLSVLNKTTFLARTMRVMATMMF